MHQSINERDVLRLCLCNPARVDWTPAEMKDVLEPDVVAHNCRNASSMACLDSLLRNRLLLKLSALTCLSEAFAAVLFSLCVKLFVQRPQRPVDCLRLVGPQVLSVVDVVVAEVDASLPSEKDKTKQPTHERVCHVNPELAASFYWLELVVAQQPDLG